MSALPVSEDGNLLLAMRELKDAVDDLCGPQSHLLDGKMIHVPSRYLQLRDAVTGEQVNTGGGGGSKSRPPFWTDAFDCLTEIDTALEIWQPAYSGTPASVGRLHWLIQRKWRPQDCHRIGQITNAVQSWVIAIEQLLNPTPRWTLPSPCPACEATVVYRRDGAGELLRQPALQLSKDGCTCQRCRYTWGPERFHILASALGYPLAEGVLTLETE